MQTFLTEHGGPGIQHIGLHTPDITEAVAALKDNGVAFIDPPAAYYSEVCGRNVVVTCLLILLSNLPHSQLKILPKTMFEANHHLGEKEPNLAKLLFTK